MEKSTLIKDLYRDTAERLQLVLIELSDSLDMVAAKNGYINSSVAQLGGTVDKWARMDNTVVDMWAPDRAAIIAHLLACQGKVDRLRSVLNDSIDLLTEASDYDINGDFSPGLTD